MMKWIFESNIPHELSHVGVQKLSVGNHEFDTNLVQKGA